MCVDLRALFHPCSCHGGREEEHLFHTSSADVVLGDASLCQSRKHRRQHLHLCSLNPETDDPVEVIPDRCGPNPTGRWCRYTNQLNPEIKFRLVSGPSPNIGCGWESRLTFSASSSSRVFDKLCSSSFLTKKPFGVGWLVPQLRVDGSSSLAKSIFCANMSSAWGLRRLLSSACCERNCDAGSTALESVKICAT